MSSYSTNYGVYANNVIDYNNKIKAIGNGGASVNTGQIVCSSNGKYVLFITYGNNKYYISTTYGKDLSNINIPSTPYSSTMSKDGQYLIIGFDNQIYRLSNYGANYKITSGSGRHYAMAFSQSGLIFAAIFGYFGKLTIGIFDNYGESQRRYSVVSNITGFNGNRYLDGDVIANASTMSISCSNSGKYVVITNNRVLYYSSDSGESFAKNGSFTAKINDPDADCSGNCSGVRISGNGKIIFVTMKAEYTGEVLLKKGGIFRSKDFGGSWEKTNAPNNFLWKRIVSSENGQYVYALADKNTYIGQTNPVIYVSNNFGDDWTNLENTVVDSTINEAFAAHITTTSSGQYALISTSNGGIANYVANNYTYSYTPIKLAYNKTFNFTFACTLYECSGTYFLRNDKNETLSTKVITDTTVNSITFTDISTNSFDYGMSNLFVYKQNDNPNDTPGYDIQISDPMVINATCFLEGTKILAMDKKRILKYIPIEKLKPGMLVKTLHAGFVPIKYIGYSTIYNPGLATRVRDQLFKCTKSAYPELIEDLVLTGNHSILVDTITDEEREQITETLGGIYVTDRKYRLPAFNDKRAVPYEQRGDFRIWNLALENEDYYANYGIYANGLLVETTSCRYIKEISKMTLVE